MFAGWFYLRLRPWWSCVRSLSSNHDLCINADENVGAEFLYACRIRRIHAHATSDSVLNLSDKEGIESTEFPTYSVQKPGLVVVSGWTSGKSNFRYIGIRWNEVHLYFQMINFNNMVSSSNIIKRLILWYYIMIYYLVTLILQIFIFDNRNK